MFVRYFHENTTFNWVSQLSCSSSCEVCHYCQALKTIYNTRKAHLKLLPSSAQAQHPTQLGAKFALLPVRSSHPATKPYIVEFFLAVALIVITNTSSSCSSNSSSNITSHELEYLNYFTWRALVKLLHQLNYLNQTTSLCLMNFLKLLHLELLQ